MQLYYCQVTTGANFGDDLNPWLWPQVFKMPLEECFDEKTLFVGIGTILSKAIPTEYERKIVFSSGTGYGIPPDIDETWEFSCVRGPLTAEKLALPPEKAITDGAILLHNLVPYSSTRNGTGFMPHHKTAVFSDWEKVCLDLGIKYIDPRGSVEEVLGEINNCELLITEAMHGAIVADVLRVPWYAVKTRKEILDFKWLDWTQSMEITNTFTLLPPVVNRGLKKYLQPLNRRLAKSRIEKMIANSKPQLSKVSTLNSRYDMMLNQVEILKCRPIF